MDLTPIIINNTEPEIDFNKLINDCYVDLSEELNPPEILISIGQYNYKYSYYDTPVMTAGEFSAIVGLSKSKKSFLKSAFLGSYIGGNASKLFPNIKSHRKEDFTILDFDTEQGKYYTQRTFRRVAEISGNNYNHYFGYATRGKTAKERLLLIDYLLKNQDKFYKTKVKLVCIDGIADLVENTNDIVMSNEASEYLMKWTYDYNIHIVLIIHKGSATNKPLGHLGTYITKKCENVIDLEIDKEDEAIVNVSNPFSRGYKFDDFSFRINNDALPCLVNRDKIEF